MERSLCVVLFVASFLVSGSLAGLVEVTDCENGTPRPERVYVSGCTQQPCVFYQNTDVQMNMTFMSENIYYSLQASITAALGPVENIPFPFPDANVCANLENNRCPVEHGEIVTYQMKLPINQYIPEVDSVRVTFKVNVPIFNIKVLCFKIEASVAKP